MNYEKQTWTDSVSPLNAERMNHIEDGIEAASIQTNVNGKKFLILGDSVNQGAGWAGGFANLITEDFPNVTVTNNAISGHKLVEEQIYYQLVSAYQNGFIPDYILIDGGGNDMLSGVSLGSIDLDTYSAGGYGDEFDKTTIAGSFEHLITNIQKFMPQAKVVFFSLYKLHPTATELALEPQRETWDMIKKGCQKYGIKYVDLFNEGNFTPYSTEQWDAFMYDWVHINEAGYRRFWSQIKQALLNA